MQFEQSASSRSFEVGLAKINLTNHPQISQMLFNRLLNRSPWRSASTIVEHPFSSSASSADSKKER